jgi:ORF6N domain
MERLAGRVDTLREWLLVRAALGKVEDITRAILVLRGRRVLLDAELAVLYGVTTRRLNEQVRRNRKRFPDDFLFELTTEEFANLKSRFATSSWGGRRKRPLAFTEHGAIQAATILNSPRAVEMSVYVVRAFVKLREVLSTNRERARRFERLESRLDSKLTEHDEAIAAILSAIRELMRPRDPPRRGIGFTAKLADDS